MLQFISQSPSGESPIAALHRMSPGADAPEALPLEIHFLLAHGVPLDVLQMAASKAKRYDVTAEHVLLSEGKITQEFYYQALGKHIDVAHTGEEVKLSAQAQFPHSVLAGLCPAEDQHGAHLWLIAPHGRQIGDLILLTQQNRLPRAHLRLITPAQLQEQVMEARAKEIAEQAVRALGDHDRDWSARTPANRLQKLLLVMGALILLVGSVLQGSFVTFLGACLGLCLLASSLLRLYALTSELEDAPFHPHTPLPEDRLPIYTILVPLYREASVVDALIRALDKIDYPAARLDIKLIVEEDDLYTWRGT